MTLPNCPTLLKRLIVLVSPPSGSDVLQERAAKAALVGFHPFRLRLSGRD